MLPEVDIEASRQQSSQNQAPTRREEIGPAKQPTLKQYKKSESFFTFNTPSTMMSRAGMVNNGVGGIGAGLTHKKSYYSIDQNLSFHQKKFNGNQYLKAKKLAPIGKRIGRVSGVASIVLGAAEAGYVIHENGLNASSGKEVGKVVVGGLAGWVGAEAGAKVGAAFGAAVGSVLPVVGTGAGALIGGIAGGIIGGWLASESIDYLYGQ